MKKDDLYDIVAHHKKANFDERTLSKLKELIKALSDEMVSDLIIFFDTDTEQLKREFMINLPSFLSLIKQEFIQSAQKKAMQTELIGGEELTRFEKQRRLTLYYYKKLLKTLPKWAQEKGVINE